MFTSSPCFSHDTHTATASSIAAIVTSIPTQCICIHQCCEAIEATAHNKRKTSFLHWSKSKGLTALVTERLILLSYQYAGTSPWLQVCAVCRSLGVLTEHNAIRRFCMAVITNVYFEGCILLLVLLSSILLALDSPSLDNSSPVGRAISAGDIIFVVCFTLEMCLKVSRQKWQQQQ